MIKKALGIFVALVSIVAISYLYTRDGSIRYVDIGGQSVAVRLASTQAELERGLGGVEHLGNNEGMLFLFPTTSHYQFWMKDMLIPLDIVWIRGTRITQISENIQPPADLQHQENLPIYGSEELIDTVLEVPAGFVERYQIKVGDSVRYR